MVISPEFLKREMNIEDSARLLAQALVGDGFIYLHGTNEMEGVVAEHYSVLNQ